MFASISSLTMKRNTKYLLLNTLDRCYIENFLKILKKKSSQIFSCLGLPTLFSSPVQEFHWTSRVNQVFQSLEKVEEITWKWLEKILVPEGVLKRWTQGQQSAKRCSRLPPIPWRSRSRWSWLEQAELPGSRRPCHWPRCICWTCKKKKKKDILGEAKALLFTQPGRGRTDAQCLKSYKYARSDLSHKDASTHNFFNHSPFPLESWRAGQLFCLIGESKP